MGSIRNLPFVVGQIAESKSFKDGFRGAWFRCKIRDIRKLKGHIRCALEYFDFPDEKVRWEKLYQIPPTGVPKEEKKLQLMVRPSFPSVYRESQMPDTCTTSEVIGIVNDVWKVGDLVDWWRDDCYWSGRITHVLDEDTVKIKLPNRPMGEGQSYEALCKDLRPSLNWSQQCGWSVPVSLDSEACHSSARLVQPANNGVDINPSKEGGSSVFRPTSVSSHGTSEPEPNQLSNCPMNEDMQLAITTADLGDDDGAGKPNQLSSCVMNENTETQLAITTTDLEDDDGTGKPTSVDDVSSTIMEPVPASTENSTGTRDECNDDTPLKKMRGSTASDTIKSSILDLEELVTKIKWLKRVHQFGFEHGNSTTPTWMFLDDPSSS